MPITDPDQDRTRFIEHDGKAILLLDYSDVQDANQALEEIEKTKRIMAQQPPGSVRALTYVKGSRYNPDIVDAMKQLVAHNKPYVAASALVGMNTLHRIIYRAVIAFSRRQIEVFDELDRAKDWLASQDVSGEDR